VASLIEEVWPDHAELFRREMQAYRSFGELFDTYFALADRGGEILGFSLLTASMMAVDLCTLSWVAVHPTCRRLGVGSALVELCAGEALRRGKSIVLATDLPRFYERCGFRMTGSFDPVKERFLMTTA
jgi:predicted N-acetyltransferase YhbS